LFRDPWVLQLLSYKQRDHTDPKQRLDAPKRDVSKGGKPSAPGILAGIFLRWFG
jgi:hypothetical protein